MYVSFYYTVGGKVSLAGLSFDPPVILKVNFLIFLAHISVPYNNPCNK